jgi:PhnB protein
MTPPNYKPDSYSTVSAYLIVPDAAATIDFMKQIFSATEIRRFPAPDGNRIMHAELRIEDSVIMVGDAAEEWPATAAHIHVYVPDVDAVYQRGLRAGASPLQEPVRKQDDDRRAGFKDPWGTSWWVATKVQ